MGFNLFMAIRVVIADDHHLIRQGLGQLLADERDIQVVEVASDGREVIDAVANSRPDVVVMDLKMPVMDGIEATARIRAEYPVTQVVMLSIHADSLSVKSALENGAAGYVTKHSTATELAEAIRSASKRAVRYSKSTKEAGIMPGYLDNPGGGRLTPREREILLLIVKGKSNHQVSQTLNISINTVCNHRASLMTKLEAHNLSDLIRIAISVGLIELDD